MTTLGLKVYTADEVKKHNTAKDAWVIVNGYVLDITSFIAKNEHPGGASILRNNLGKDITDMMRKTHHSPYSFELVKSFRIGTVRGDTPREEYALPEEDMRGRSMKEVTQAIDPDKPLLTQVMSTGEMYWAWVSTRPILKHQRIFESNFFEALSRWPWWYIFVLWGPVMSYLVHLEFTRGQLQTCKAGYSFALGCLLWTMFEYFLHRFAFHTPTWTNAQNFFHYFAHGVHHLTPTDSSRLTFPPPFAAAIGFTVFNFLHYALGNYSDVFVINLIFVGFNLFYVMYDTAHFFYHHSDVSNPFFRRFKALHLAHHYKDEYMNFGVTSPLWDIVFGTYDPVRK